jgi:hypothetical protein
MLDESQNHQKLGAVALDLWWQFHPTYCALAPVLYVSNLLLLPNGRTWIYSISLLASQYSFGNSLEVWSSFGHPRR